MTPLELTTLVLAVLAVIGVAAAAIRNRAVFRASNEVVPGVTSPAPESWAGSHTAEARLHRRLRDAVRAVRAAAPSGDETATGPFRTSVEQEALALDERLVAIAALPQRVRGTPLQEITLAVDALEDAAAQLVTHMRAESQGVPQALADVTERLQFLAEARAELDASYERVTHPGPTTQPGSSA
jgi:hypothetical protein